MGRTIRGKKPPVPKIKTPMALLAVVAKNLLDDLVAEPSAATMYPQEWSNLVSKARGGDKDSKLQLLMQITYNKLAVLLLLNHSIRDASIYFQWCFSSRTHAEIGREFSLSHFRVRQVLDTIDSRLGFPLSQFIEKRTSGDHDKCLYGSKPPETEDELLEKIGRKAKSEDELVEENRQEYAALAQGAFLAGLMKTVWGKNWEAPEKHRSGAEKRRHDKPMGQLAVLAWAEEIMKLDREAREAALRILQNKIKEHIKTNPHKPFIL